MINEGTLLPAENNKDRISRFVWDNCQKICSKDLVNDSKTKGTAWTTIIKSKKDEESRPEITLDTLIECYTTTTLEKEMMYSCAENLPELYRAEKNSEEEEKKGEQVVN